LPSYIGRLVHYVIQKVIERIRSRRKLAPDSLLLKVLEERIRWEISYSAAEKWRQVDHPKKATLILRQHLMGEDLHKPQIEEAVKRGLDALSAFLDRYLPYIRTLTPKEILLIDSLDSLEYRGFKLFMSPDFVASRPNERTIIDWKTGARANLDQLKIYAKYLVAWELRENEHVLDPSQITGRSVTLLHPENEGVIQISPEHLVEATARIDRDIDLLNQYHAHGIAREELAFPKTEHTGECEYCSFRFYCDLRPR